MRPTVVINVVGLSSSLLGEASPRLSRYAQRGRLIRLQPVLPAVTCSVQASMLTGLMPGASASAQGHGIVGNGWYDRETCEVRIWQRSDHLMRGEKVWDIARRMQSERARKRESETREEDGRTFTCANLFWWYNSYSTCDYVVQARPMYKADGRKIPDCYTYPPELRDTLQAAPPAGLGRFPLFHFWGPLADIRSSCWIAEAALRVYEQHHPTLTLIYLPHLDYCLQKLGPDHADIPRHVGEIDSVVGRLLDAFEARGVRVIVLSEYGIEPIVPGDGAIRINRMLREAGLIAVREEDGLEQLDAGTSRAFAVADHQVAHVYLNRSSSHRFALDRDMETFRVMFEHLPGVDQVLDRDAQREAGIDAPRSGEWVLVADHGRWFTYDYWLDDTKAPDFARTVDIHRKPGYDPRELFIDPGLKFPRAATAWKLLKRKLGFRQLLDVTPLDTALVRGTHGRIDQPPPRQPVLIVPEGFPLAVGENGEPMPCTAVRDVILRSLFEDVQGDVSATGRHSSV